MALVFADGFDHYLTSDILKKWTDTNLTTTSPTVSHGVNSDWARPPGGKGLRIAGTNFYLRKLGLANYATFICGFNLYVESGLGAGGPFVYFLDGTTEQMSLRMDASGHIIMSRSGTTLATSTNVIAANTWYHVEVKITIDNTAGAYECRVNGSATGWIPAATSQDTQMTANAYVNGVALGATGGGTVSRYDDFYFLNTSGGVNDTFIGAQKIITCYPSGVGNYAQWTGNYAANQANVNEQDADGDTTFNQTATAGNIDSFGFDDVPAGTIAAIQHVIEARQDAGAARTIAPLQRSGSTDYVGDSKVLAGSYLFYTDPDDVDPATTAAWVVANFNAAEFGYKLIS